MSTPLLSIGIIFKNDIRCIERCLKALQPLRDAAPCELVMADTGSTDGSREIVEKYADILIEFPWIDDFAAARNAVMDRCSGLWYFSVDTDEYLDSDVSELVAFLRSDEHDEPIAMINIRNYNTYEMNGDYSDFLAGRILRMSTGVRYEGAIHEHLNYQGEVQAYPLTRTTLHHDGYAGLYDGSEAGKAKAQRNVRMIKKALEHSPDSLLLRMQLLEAGSTSNMPDYEKQVRKAVEMVKEKRTGWEQLGPPILRTALYAAERLELHEWGEWLELAEKWFPGSMFICLDIQYAAFVHEWNEGKDQEHAILRGERYLKALADYRSGAGLMDQAVSPLQMATPHSECEVKIHMINAYCLHNRLSDAFEIAKTVDYTLLSEGQMSKLVSALQDVQFKTSLDTAPVISQLWETISEPGQIHKKMNPWKSSIQKVASRAFLRKNRDAEQEKSEFVRHAYTLYLPLQGKWELGTAAAVMEMHDSNEIETALMTVEDWNQFSIHALIHALECGAQFPLPGKPMNIEVMDTFAARLAKDKDNFLPLTLEIAKKTTLDSWRSLCWIHSLLMAAVRTYPWSGQERDEDQGMALARVFARTESAFLSFCYSAEVLQEDKLFALPPLHRFGWYCAQAFDALEQGEPVEYVRLLRSGLDAYEGVKDMVEFLVDHTAEVQQLMTPPELKALADQVRVILARFAPDDPAVAALKQSEAYQKVAHLIEGMSVPVWGGLVQ